MTFFPSLGRPKRDERESAATQSTASAETWREFSQAMPKPMFHGIWSASFRKDLKIEGNHLVLMKNLRNFTVQFELLRKCGVPV